MTAQPGGGHLPECPKSISEFHNYCECTILRACETRVKNRALAEAEVRINAEHSKGFASGLDAAWDTVAALPQLGTTLSISGPAALAAIDALRGPYEEGRRL